MRKLIYFITVCFCIISSNACSQNTKVIDNFKVIHTDRNENNSINYIDLSFRYNKGIESIDFLYLTFAEFNTCISESIISKRYKIIDSLSTEDENIIYRIDLSKFAIHSFDYARLKISDIDGIYSNDIEIGI